MDMMDDDQSPHFLFRLVNLHHTWYHLMIIFVLLLYQVALLPLLNISVMTL